MEIYTIGAMFTFGYLIRFDERIEKFDGFKGTCLLILLCLIWPIAMGHLVAHINLEE